MPPLLRSRMLTPAFRVYAGLVVFGLLGAFLQAFTSDQPVMDAVLGPLTLGWKGGVGNHFAYVTLLSLAIIAGLLGGLHLAFRDADPEAEAQVLHTDSVPLTRAPYGTNFLPLVATLGIATAVIGLVTNKYTVLVGCGLLVIVLFVWTLRTWAERATGDAEINAEIYSRFIEPLRVPVVSAIVVAVLVLGFSRVLLAVSEVGAVAVFGVVGALFLIGAVLLAARPQISKNAITIVLFILAVLVIAAGIGAAVVGQRDIEEHDTEHSTEGATQEHGLGVIVIEAPVAEGEA